MPVARPESSETRVIAHVDLDCFYVQVEQRKQPELWGQPTAVVQYNEWKGGALIAVSYEARKYGVKRSMRGSEAKEVCPEIHLVQVPVVRGKADLNGYRSAGSEVVSILARKGRCERASIDEVYLDLTVAAETMLAEGPPDSLEMIDDEALKSHILGLSSEDGRDIKELVKDWMCRIDADHSEKLLSCGILIVAELRKQVLKETGFTCSAGIAHNKMLAKLASGMNKPAQQTVVPHFSVQGLLDSLPIKKMKQLGGKLGTSLQIDLGVNSVGDLLQFFEGKLQDLYGTNTGTWLWNVARGISGEEVQSRLLPKSHGSGKTFPGPRALKNLSDVQHWLNQLCEELNERLSSDMEQNRRIASTLTLHATAFKTVDSDLHKKFPSKSCSLRYGASKIQEDAFNLFQAALREYMDSYGIKTQGKKQGAWRITSLSVSASKIEDIPAGTSSIMRYFHNQSSTCFPKKSSDGLVEELGTMCPTASESCLDQKSVESQFELPAVQENDIIPGHVEDEEEELPKQQIPLQLDSGCSTNRASDASTQSRTDLTLSGTQTQIFRNEEGIKMEKLEEKNPVTKKRIQGMYSIENIFKCYSKSLSSAEERHQGEGSECNIENLPRDQGRERNEEWSYKADEIDQTVMDELPSEIRQEIETWLRPRKRPNVVKAGSSIDRYFSPAKRLGNM